MRRREFISLIGGTAAWPFAARAQKKPVIGLLHPTSPERYAHLIAAFRRGLSQVGYVEGQNVGIEYRWAQNDLNRLPELAADLVRNQVAVIAAPGSTPAALAAQAVTTTIPIVFAIGTDPVEAGLVASLNRPGGNITGISYMQWDLGLKRVELIYELLPRAARFVLLVNPDSPVATETAIKNAHEAASGISRQIEVLAARTSQDIDDAFGKLLQRQAEALLVNADPLFLTRRLQLVTLASRHGVPTIYPNREYCELGGLISYGPDLAEQFREVGVYTGRVLNGEKPADLPVIRSTKFELVVNLVTAKTLGIDVPPTLLARADEVIE